MGIGEPSSRALRCVRLGAAALAAAGSIVLIERPGIVRVPDRDSTMPAVPGVTVDDDDGRHTPVVTSLRSDCQAERRGLRVGDHIDAVDGLPVRSAGDLRQAVAGGAGGRAVALHVRRGDALWTLSIDRSEPRA